MMYNTNNPTFFHIEVEHYNRGMRLLTEKRFPNSKNISNQPERLNEKTQKWDVIV